MRCWLGLLTLGFALLGCSGKYVVGTMDDPNGAGGSYPTAGQGVGAYGPGGYSNQGDAGAFAVAGTTSYAGGAAYAGGSAGGSMPTGGAPDGARFGVAEYCVGPSTSLFQFDEPIASRDVIWQRMSRLLHGKVVAPPPDWSEMVSAPQMLVIINRELESLNNGQAPGSEGAGLFLIDWLELEGPMATDQIYYQALMSSNTDLMFLLLQQEHFGSLSVGVFTEPEWLVQNKTISSRGAKMMNQLFGTSVPLPPPGSIMNGTPDPNLPDRQALDKQIEQPVCRSCHVLVDPPGYALDIFDSAGQWRTTDHGQPIDTSGQLRLMLEQRDLPFADLKDLMTKASQTCDANVAVADAFLRFAMRINGFDEASIEGVPPADKALVENRFLYGGRSYGSLLRAYLETSVGHAP